MSDMLLTYEANPGALGASVAGLYFNLTGQLCYVLNDGTERVVPMTLQKRKTADQSLATQIVLQNDTHLSFPIAASEEWIAELSLDAGAALATTGIKLAVTVPAAGTGLNVLATLAPDVITAANFCALRTTVSGTALDFTAAKEAAVGNAGIKVSIWVLNGVNAGTVQLQWCQSTSSGTNTTLRKGSSLVARQLA